MTEERINKAIEGMDKAGFFYDEEYAMYNGGIQFNYRSWMIYKFECWEDVENFLVEEINP